MRKKHDEGYTLVLVLIVMLIMSMVAVSVLSISASNIRKQGESVRQMQDKYKAAGAIEEAVALISAELEENSSEFGKEYLEKLLDTQKITFSEPVLVSEGEKETVSVQLEARSDDVVIVCELLIEGTVALSGEGMFDITDPKLTYAAYEVTVEPETAAEPTNGGGEE